MLTISVQNKQKSIRPNKNRPWLFSGGSCTNSCWNVVAQPWRRPQHFLRSIHTISL